MGWENFATNAYYKLEIKYVIAFTLGFTLARFFLLFLVMKEVSVMMLTVKSMLVDVMSFMVIFVMYIAMAVQLFWTYYADMNPGYYHDTVTYLNALQTVFDSALGGYEYIIEEETDVFNRPIASWEEYFLCIVTVLNLYFLFIILLNYLIAILSGSYADMTELGAFAYKCI